MQDSRGWSHASKIRILNSSHRIRNLTIYPRWLSGLSSWSEILASSSLITNCTHCNHNPGWAAPFEGHHAVHQAMDRGADDCWLQGARHHHRCHSYHSGVDEIVIISFIRIYSIIFTISCRRRNVKRRLQQRPLTLPCLDNFHPMMMMMMMELLMLMMVDDGDDDDATWVNARESSSSLASRHCQRQWCHLWSPGSDLQWTTGYHHWPFLDSGVCTKLLS